MPSPFPGMDPYLERPSVYIETTVVSYRVALPSRDAFVAGHQRTTVEWWDTALPKVEPFVSTIVLGEIAKGDPEWANRRISAVQGFSVLQVDGNVERLAEDLRGAISFPLGNDADSFHLALAAWHGMDCLLTWNCSHIAGASVRRIVERICKSWKIRAPIICTPEELMNPEELKP